MLVHCVSGVSRSPSVVMAYIMAELELDCPKAFRMLKKAHRPSCPNVGFREQIKLFGEMGCTLDREHPEYRMFLLKTKVDDFNIGATERIELAADPEASTRAGAAHNPSLEPAAGGAAGHSVIRCKKCRRKLATGYNVLDHPYGSGQIAFRWRRRDPSSEGKSCTSIFIEPIRWMEDLVAAGATQGKLCCPKCSSRVGSYNWAGGQCSCGAWITPAFQLNASRVDVMRAPAQHPAEQHFAPPQPRDAAPPTLTTAQY